MTDSRTTPQSDADRPGPILVPIRVLEDQSIEPGVVTLLSRANVFLLGYHELPEQTPPGQARLQFEDRANERLEALKESLEEGGATVETRLVFTQDRQQTFDRVAKEEACIGTVILNPSMEMESVLVPLRGGPTAERIAKIVGTMLAETGVSITLYHLEIGVELRDGERRKQRERETTERGDEDVIDLSGDPTGLERGAEILLECGVDADLLETRVDTTATPVRRIARTAEEFDAVVMGESDPGVITFVFGQSATQIADRFNGPVLVVRRQEVIESGNESASVGSTGEPGGTDSENE